MKYLLLLITLITTNLNAQNILKFDKRNVQCENKWIVRQIDKDSIYTFGFIYIDSQAGLTFNYEGKFKIDKNGKFIRIKEEPISQKQRLVPNRIALAEIPEDKFKELTIEKEPSWMKFYKGDVNSVEHLYRWGYIYNGYQESEIALTYLEKADKINPNFEYIIDTFYKDLNKDINQIMYAQKKATEIVFKNKNIPFRSFEIRKRDEKTLGELFCFFILETILIGKALKINPFDQPAVELIKKETKKILN